jgi:hypothetical protein
MRVVDGHCAKVLFVRWVAFFLIVFSIVSFAVNTQEGSSSFWGVQGAPKDTLLDHAVLLWEASVLAPEELQTGEEMVGVGDINKDGIPDIVCSHGSGILVFAGDGMGHFTAADEAPYETQEGDDAEEAQQTGYFMTLTGCLADIDGDEDLDLAVSGIFSFEEELTSRIYLFRNEEGSLEKVGVYDLENLFSYLWPVTLRDDESVDLLAAMIEEDEEGYYPRFFLLAGKGDFTLQPPVGLLTQVRGWPFFVGDVDGDGLLDLAVRDLGKAVVLLGDESGAFSDSVEFVPQEGRLYSASLGDLNEDGGLDLVAALDDQIVIALQENGVFANTKTYSVEMEPHEVFLSDLDGDEHLDILVSAIYGQAFTILPGDGEGGLPGHGSEFIPRVPALEVWPVDVTLDGRVDLVFDEGYSVTVLVNGGCPDGVSRLPLGGSMLFGSGDLDGNDAIDLIAEGRSGLDVLWNDGHGALVRQELAAIPDLDLMAAVIEAGCVSVLGYRTVTDIRTGEEMNVGEICTFSPAGEELARHAVRQEVLPLLCVGDFDGNSRSDLVWLTEESIFVWWDKEVVEEYPIEGGLSLAVVDDFDGDGLDDVAVVAAREYADLLVVSFNNREPVVSGPRLQLEALPLALSAGDIDRDSLPDLVTLAITFEVESDEDADTPQVEIAGVILGAALSTGSTKIVDMQDFPEGDAPWPLTGLAVGDVNGDGAADLFYSTMGGAGLFHRPGLGNGDFNESIHYDVPAGPLLVVDLDGNEENEIVTSTLGLNPILGILWNGGGR